MAMLVGLIIAWGVCVPILTHLYPAAGPAADTAIHIWKTQVRFIGAGAIGSAAIWTLGKLAAPVWTGLMSAMAASRVRSAGEGGKFGIPATRLGLGYGPSGVKKLMDLVGPSHVKEIFFTARHFSAAEALAMGLVNRVVPEAELEAYVRSYCLTIAENAPLTMLAVKRTVDELAKTSPAADLALCDRLVQACFDSEDYVEGRTAFMEKRRPVFKGR